MQLFGRASHLPGTIRRYDRKYRPIFVQSIFVYNMKKFILSLGLLLSIVAQAQSQGSQDYAFLFRKVKIKGIMEVVMTQGAESKIHVEGDPAALSDLRVEANNGELVIATRVLDQITTKRYDYEHEKARIRVQITFTELEAVESQRGADVRVTSEVKAGRFKAEASSGGLLYLTVQTPLLKMEAVQGGQLTISGKATYQESRVATGGELHAFDLSSEEVNIRANTGGMAQVRAEKSLEAHAGTGASIEYRGNPRNRAVNTSLGGEIRQH
jgi:hypothetical protein